MVEFGQQLFFSRAWDLVKKKLAMLVEQGVWDACWVPDHLRGLPPFAIDAFLSPWTMLGAFAELAPMLKIGVSVTDGIRLHPAITAQNAASLDHQSNGRFILGIGAGEKMNLAVYGFSNKKAVSRMRESIEVMKLLWTTHGPVDFEGEFFRLKRAVLEPKPVQRPHVPVWIAGNSSMTRRITAELGDGWFPFLVLPKLYKTSLNEIYQHMKQIGRDPSALTPGLWGRIYMHDDPTKISQHLFQQRGQLFLEPRLLQELGYWKDEYTKIYHDQGIDPQRLSLLTYDADDVANLDISKLLPIVADIPEEVIASINLVGSPEEITKKLEQYVNAGAQHFCFELLNGVSSRNAPYTYWDVSRILAENVIPSLKD